MMMTCIENTFTKWKNKLCRILIRLLSKSIVMLQEI